MKSIKYSVYIFADCFNLSCFELQNANSSDIKKAFRRLSLQLHPDKNSAEDAEIKFRNVSFKLFRTNKI